MVLYNCPRCHKTFNKISHYKRHINRKNKCIVKPSFESCAKDLINTPINVENKCKYCNKIFTRKFTLKRHYNICKIKKNDDENKKKQDFFNILLNKINDLNIIVENQNNIIKDLQDKIEGNVKVNDVKDIIKSLKKDIKLNRTEIIHFKYKT